jgi:hypothetical protein
MDTNLSIFPEKSRTYFNKHDKQEPEHSQISAINVLGLLPEPCKSAMKSLHP